MQTDISLKTYSLTVDYTYEDAKRRRSIISVEALDIGDAYNKAHELMKTTGYLNVKFGACVPGVGVLF